MSYFQVTLSGAGISLPVEGNVDPAIGFFTTRNVSAHDPEQAKVRAKELVISEWLPNGEYSKANNGSVPVLSVDSIEPIGVLKGIFSRKPSGYTFYSHDN